MAASIEVQVLLLDDALCASPTGCPRPRWSAIRSPPAFTPVPVPGYRGLMAHDFSGKTVLVTGGGSGIGRATVLAFARAGADLVLCDVDERGLAETEAAARALGREVLARRVDVASRDAMRAFAEEVHRGRAAVDILVNNAGVGLGGSFLDTPLEDWDWIIAVNLGGVIHGCHFFIPPMVHRGQGGHVVNISSTAGFYAPADLSAYATTKFGVFGLSEALRDELAPHRIGVSTICPGVINTPIVDTGRYHGRLTDPAYRAQMSALFKRRNFGPEKVAASILDAVAHRREVVPVTPEAWAIYALKRAAPALVPAVFRRVRAFTER